MIIDDSYRTTMSLGGGDGYRLNHLWSRDIRLVGHADDNETLITVIIIIIVIVIIIIVVVVVVVDGIIGKTIAAIVTWY